MVDGEVVAEHSIFAGAEAGSSHWSPTGPNTDYELVVWESWSQVRSVPHGEDVPRRTTPPTLESGTSRCSGTGRATRPSMSPVW